MPQKKQSSVARVGAVNKALDQFNLEQGKKIAELLMQFHLNYVTPLEERIAYLETPWWRRWWRALTARILILQKPEKGDIPATIGETHVEQDGVMVSEPVTADSPVGGYASAK